MSARSLGKSSETLFWGLGPGRGSTRISNTENDNTHSLAPLLEERPRSAPQSSLFSKWLPTGTELPPTS